MVTVDDRNGMMFNRRRQSQDRVLRQKILALSVGSRLLMNHYSEKQFLEDVPEPGQLLADDSFMDMACPGDYCFVENVSCKPYENQIEKLILFKWNRKYPGDFFFDLDLKDGTWELTGTEDFPGSSHEKITMEIYEKKIPLS